MIEKSTEEENLTHHGQNYSEIFEVTMVQLRDCSQNLKISRSTEAKLAYTCFLWSKEPNGILWTLFGYLILLFLLIPLMICIIDIYKLRSEGNSRHGLHFGGGKQYIKLKEPLK